MKEIRKSNAKKGKRKRSREKRRKKRVGSKKNHPTKKLRVESLSPKIFFNHVPKNRLMENVSQYRTLRRPMTIRMAMRPRPLDKWSVTTGSVSTIFSIITMARGKGSKRHRESEIRSINGRVIKNRTRASQGSSVQGFRRNSRMFVAASLR